MQIVRFAAIHVNKDVVYIVEDVDNCLYRCPLHEFLDLISEPHTAVYKYIIVPHIVWLRANEREGTDRTNLDFAICTMLEAPNSLFGTSKLDTVFDLLWDEFNKKETPQP